MKYLISLVIGILFSFSANALTFKVAETGHVDGYFLGASAGYENLFTINFEDVSSTPIVRPAWISNQSPIGTHYDFGTHQAGMQAVFVDKVMDGSVQNKWYYSLTEFNPDHQIHFMFHRIYMEDMTPALIVRWEDIFGGGDRDFNDHVLLVTNIIPVVPEPSSLLMLLGGLALLPLFKKKESRNGGGGGCITA